MASPWVEWRTPSLAERAARLCARTLAPLLRLARVEPAAFEHILVARVLIEQRGGKGPGRLSVAITLALCLLLGFFLAGLVQFTRDPFLWSFLDLSLTSSILAIALFFQLGNLLLDGTDLHVIGPLPVPERTLYAARIAHTLLYTLALAACMQAIPLLAAVFRLGPLACLALPPAVLLAAAFVVAAVALLHALLLRLWGPERHARATLWAQILLGSSAFGFQLGHRLFDFGALSARLEARPELLYAFPPAWFAGLFALLMGHASRAHAALAGASLLAPALALACALSLARRDLIAGLSQVRGGRASSRPWRTTMFQRLGRRIARAGTERAGYDWALTLSRREPAFLRTAYAQIAGYTLMGISFLFLEGEWREPGHAPYVLYAVPLIVPTVLELASFSEHPESAGFLRPLPFEPRGRFYAGALKALLLGTPLPVYVLLLLCALLFGGLAALPEVLLAASLSALLALTLARIDRVPLPFTRLMRYGAMDNVNLAVVIGTLLASVAAGVAHFLLGFVPGLRLAAAAVAAVLAALQGHALGRTLVRRGAAMEAEFLHQGEVEDARAARRERLLEG